MSSSNAKQKFRVIQGEGKGLAAPPSVEIVETPERLTFDCPQCGASCIAFPRAKPIAVQHAKPECKLWKKGETARFLIKAGVHLHVPGSEKN